jgi:hypothetical protein
MAAEDLFDALTSSRAHLTDRYQADHEILKRLKRKKCEAKRDAYAARRCTSKFWASINRVGALADDAGQVAYPHVRW